MSTMDCCESSNERRNDLISKLIDYINNPDVIDDLTKSKNSELIRDLFEEKLKNKYSETAKSIGINESLSRENIDAYLKRDKDGFYLNPQAELTFEGWSLAFSNIKDILNLHRKITSEKTASSKSRKFKKGI